MENNNMPDINQDNIRVSFTPEGSANATPAPAPHPQTELTGRMEQTGTPFPFTRLGQADQAEHITAGAPITRQGYSEVGQIGPSPVLNRAGLVGSFTEDRIRHGIIGALHDYRTSISLLIENIDGLFHRYRLGNDLSDGDRRLFLDMFETITGSRVVVTHTDDRVIIRARSVPEFPQGVANHAILLRGEAVLSRANYNLYLSVYHELRECIRRSTVGPIDDTRLQEAIMEAGYHHTGNTLQQPAPTPAPAPAPEAEEETIRDDEDNDEDNEENDGENGSIRDGVPVPLEFALQPNSPELLSSMEAADAAKLRLILQAKKDLDAALESVSKNAVKYRSLKGMSCADTAANVIAKIQAFTHNDLESAYFAKIGNAIRVVFKLKHMVTNVVGNVPKKDIGKLIFSFKLDALIKSSGSDFDYSITNTTRVVDSYHCAHSAGGESREICGVCMGGYTNIITSTILELNFEEMMDFLIRFLKNPNYNDTWGRHGLVFPNYEEPVVTEVIPEVSDGVV
jgi:hypothetical protein